MNWNEIKIEVTTELDKAGIDGVARKTILALERKLVTCRNLLTRGATWEALGNSAPYRTARDLMDELNACGEWGMEKAPHWDSWCSYQEVQGNGGNCTLGDMIC
tara:strand:- start:1300 stop:1611 length:312 start_codon:yes stop_codon:yes gene_type:complete